MNFFRALVLHYGPTPHKQQCIHGFLKNAVPARLALYA
jgi:hypothetical protein